MSALRFGIQGATGFQVRHPSRGLLPLEAPRKFKSYIIGELMKRILIVLLMMLSFLCYGSMTTTKGNYAACISEEAFDMYLDAVVSGDKGTMVSLLQRQSCIILKPNIRVNRKSVGLFGPATFIFNGFTFYTFAEALN